MIKEEPNYDNRRFYIRQPGCGEKKNWSVTRKAAVAAVQELRLYPLFANLRFLGGAEISLIAGWASLGEGQISRAWLGIGQHAVSVC
jgi:hypothetical protein